MQVQSGDDGFDNTTVVMLPAWPCNWDVSFKLWGPLRTTVSAQSTLVCLVLSHVSVFPLLGLFCVPSCFLAPLVSPSLALCPLSYRGICQSGHCWLHCFRLFRGQVEVVFQNGTLVSLDVQPPARRAAVKWAACVDETNLLGSGGNGVDGNDGDR